MPTTGVTLIPPSTGTSLASKLIAHLSRYHPEVEQFPFHLEHRLFNDTSSQLPPVDPTQPLQRAYTHLLSFSHDILHAFVCSTKPGHPSTSSTITIPISQFESFTALIFQKLQPAWYPRQMLSVENGVSVRLRINGTGLGLSIGDAKVAARSPGAGTLRGTIIEVFREEDPIIIEEYTKDDAAEDQAEFQAALNTIFKETGSVFDSAQFATNRTLSREEGADPIKNQNAEPDWSLAKLYMTVFTPTPPKTRQGANVDPSSDQNK